MTANLSKEAAAIGHLNETNKKNMKRQLKEAKQTF